MFAVFRIFQETFKGGDFGHATTAFFHIAIGKTVPPPFCYNNELIAQLEYHYATDSIKTISSFIRLSVGGCGWSRDCCSNVFISRQVLNVWSLKVAHKQKKREINSRNADLRSTVCLMGRSTSISHRMLPSAGVGQSQIRSNCTSTLPALHLF